MKIICIGRNYKAHVEELHNRLPENPIFFMKPETSLLPRHHPFYFPEFTKELHYECELVLKICRLGKHIDLFFSLGYVESIGIGIDFTARDLQRKCKEEGLPWEIAKAWDFSAPLGAFIRKEEFEDLKNISFSLQKNGETIQQGNSRDMIFSFSQIITYVSKFITLKQGDIIFTGTPEGVGPVKSGDLLEGYIFDQKCLKLKIM